jgi:photosystem II stability/assembly factor-like uncharacterized protein
MRIVLVLVLGVAMMAQPPTSRWERQTIATESDFRGICAVSSTVAWVSGTKGTFGRTVDGGKTWQTSTVPGAEALDFRDVEAFSETVAYVLSIGPGENSRIYKTLDGGKTWKLHFKNPDPAAFYDALAFWDERHGIALSDPVNGKFRLLMTEDGDTWNVISDKAMPAALPGEGAFAASGTCLITQGHQDVWFVTGGATAARVFHSPDRGKSWTVSETPLMAGRPSAGAFSLAFQDRQHGLIVGGDYRQPNETAKTVAITADGGMTWKPLEARLPFRSGAAWRGDRWIVVGTSGSHQSRDLQSWEELDRENYNVVSFAPSGDGWAAGPKGRIAKFVK